MRRDEETGFRFYEVLSHAPGAIDMSRAQNGMPFFAEHDPHRQVGRIEDLGTHTDGRMRGWVRFGSHPDAGWVRQDMIDGIRPDVSVGYFVSEYELSEARSTEPDVFTATRWGPYEGSSVSLPADTSVGVGRSAEGAGVRPQEPAPTQVAPEAREDKVEPTTAAPERAEDKVDAAQIRKDAVDKERERVQELAALCNKYGAGERMAEWAGDPEMTAGKAAQILLADQRKGLVAIQGAGAASEIPEQELRKYSVASAILQDVGEEAPGFETEVHRFLQDKLGSPSGKRGFMIPTTGIKQRTLNSITATDGAEGVFDEYVGFLEMLRTRTKVINLGAQVESGLVGNPTFVKQTAAMTLTWRTENTAEDTPNADTADSDVQFGTVQMTPHTAQATTGFTRQQLRRSVFDTEGVVERDFAAIHARGIDHAAIHGTGSEPTGIYGITNVNTVAMGGVVTYAKLVDMETEIFADDADLGSMAYLTTPEIRGAAKKTQMFSGTNGMPIWTGGVDGGEVNGYRADASNQISKVMLVLADTGGTSHGIVFGVWSNLMIGEWGVLELITDPYRLKKQGIIEVTSFQMLDVQVRYPEAFCVGTGLTLS